MPACTPTIVANAATPTVTAVQVAYDILSPGNINYDGTGVPPGAVIACTNGAYTQLRFSNLVGTALNPITIRNYGGQVTCDGSGGTGIYLRNCEHVVFSGSGTPSYGFSITGGLIAVREESTNIVFERIDTTTRMDIKETGVGYESWEMTDIHVRYCYLHGINSEAIYIGSSSYDSHPGDFVMRRVYVHNNIIDDAAEGIQCGSIVEDCQIYLNTLDDINPDGGSFTDAAIMINPGTYAWVYRNDIDDCEGVGIYNNNNYTPVSFPVEIYNNRIHNVGHTMSGREDGIREDNSSDYTTVYNNTIVTVGFGAAGYGINMGAGTHGYAFNNVILDTVAASIEDGGNDPSHFYNNDTKEEGHTPVNYDFVDQASGDYHLTADSPGVDAGTNTGAPANDLDGKTRPIDGTTDIGCYEFGCSG